MGYLGSAKTCGKLLSSSDSNSVKPSKAASFAYPPYADRCVKFSSPTYSTNAKCTVSVRASLANFAALISSHVRCDSNATAPCSVKNGRNPASRLAHTLVITHVCLQTSQTCTPSLAAVVSNGIALHFGHSNDCKSNPAHRASPAALMQSSTMCYVFFSCKNRSARPQSTSSTADRAPSHRAPRAVVSEDLEVYTTLAKVFSEVTVGSFNQRFPRCTARVLSTQFNLGLTCVSHGKPNTHSNAKSTTKHQTCARH